MQGTFNLKTKKSAQVVNTLGNAMKAKLGQLQKLESTESNSAHKEIAEENDQLTKKVEALQKKVKEL